MSQQSLQSSARSTSQTSVLLIEEYDALAAAIGSALKKFAPQHEINVASSLDEAEALAKVNPPVLIVIDFDPAYPGATDFLYRVRETCPDARVLVMGAGVSDEIAAEFRPFGALQFVAKPFELADFGAAVKALLVSSPDAAEVQPRGTLRSMSVADLVLLQCAGNRSVVLEIKSRNAKWGEVHVVDGHLVHALAGKREDVEALAEMFSWSESRIEEVEDRSSAPRTIQEAWAPLFMQAVRGAAARWPLPSAPVVAEPVTAKPRLKTGKKLVVIDDTEMLLIFVEETLAIADPELQIATASNGTAGISQVERTLPDLVLLDYSLPDFNGDEVCRRLLANEQTARIPVMIMSGHIPEMKATAAQFENVVATISKPFLSEALVARVQQTLSAGFRPVPKAPKPIETPKPPPAEAVSKIQSPPQPERTQRTEAPPIIATKPAPSLPQAPLQSEAAPLFPRASILSAPPPQPPARSTISLPVVSTEPNEVVLGLFLEVVSMQLTPSLRMGTIRAKPSSLTASLRVSPAALRATLPVETGFQLGRVELDASGKIATMRLIPTLQPFQRLETRNAVQIGALDVMPHNSREQLQLTPMKNAPMRMHLLAHLELAGVELASDFRLGQIVLKSRSNTVRVSLNSDAVGQEQTGVFCETAAIRLDELSRLSELLLRPLK